MAVRIEAQGHTVDEAIQIALNQLGVGRDKVEIEILHHPRRGFLGIGARRAKVRATLRESVMADGEEFDMSGGTALDEKPRRRRRRGGRNRGRGDERPEGATPSPAPARPAPAGGRDRDGQRSEGRRSEGERQRADGDRSRNDQSRGRDDRRGGRGRDRRGEGPRTEGRGEQRPDNRGPESRGDAREPQRGEGRERGQQRLPREQGERRDRPRPRAEETESVAETASDTALRSEPIVEAAPLQADRNGQGHRFHEEPPADAAGLDAIRIKAEELVRELLAKMGFEAEVSSSIDEAAGEAVVSVRSESEGLLIGRRGQTLDSLEHIINRMAMRGDAYVEGRVLLDIGDYRRRRRESLEELAGRLRSRAIAERRTVQVSPMSPRDRKFFGQAFADDESIEVRALGAGFYRRVVVAPAGMGAAALASAESVSDIDDESIDGAEAEG